MNGIFYIGATGLDAQQRAVETVANNITNLNTAAYKRGTVSFAELISPTQVTPSQREYAAGVMARPTAHVFSQGQLNPTGNSLDVAIQGTGFIELVSAEGEALLWRGGTLRVGADGMLSASNGLPLRALISVPNDTETVAISASGEVMATMHDDSEPVVIGQIDLALPADPQQLQAIGDGVYRLPDDGLSLTRATPGEDQAGHLVQGSIEASNIELSDEMVSLMIYQRAYASSARLVQIGDELMGIANGLKRS